MFFFMIGITEGVRHLLYDKTVYCRDCDQRTRVRIAMTYTCFSLFLIPLFKWNRHFYVEFACCKRHYELNPELGMRILRGEAPDITPADLIPVEEAPEERDAERMRREASDWQHADRETAEGQAARTGQSVQPAAGFSAAAQTENAGNKGQEVGTVGRQENRQYAPAKEEEEDRSGKRYCPHCGEEIDPRMDDCPHCGGKL